MKLIWIFILFTINSHSMEWENGKRGGMVEDRRGQVYVPKLPQNWLKKYCPHCEESSSIQLKLSSSVKNSNPVTQSVQHLQIREINHHNSLIEIEVIAKRNFTDDDVHKVCQTYFPKRPLGAVINSRLEKFTTINDIKFRYEMRCFNIPALLYATGERAREKFNLPEVNDSSHIIYKETDLGMIKSKSPIVSPK